MTAPPGQIDPSLRDQALAQVRAEVLRFALDRFPFAAGALASAFDRMTGNGTLSRVFESHGTAAASEFGRLERGAREPSEVVAAVAEHVRESLQPQAPRLTELGEELLPREAPRDRWKVAVEEVVQACVGALQRAALRISLTRDERREILRGMILTRAVDNQLKAFFSGGEVRYRARGFQGKGFRSLGQEAIYAAGIRLRRGESFRGHDGAWNGDVVAPLIRDLGAALAMRPTRETVRMVLNAQMGKAGPPMNGKDLHVGDFDGGVLPATAPLAISTLTVAGLAMGFHLQDAPRVAVSFIGEGGTSLGEWHEAINLCAARRLPAVFCVQNNQTALSTPLRDQSRVRRFADKAAGYGIPGVVLDGTDPDAVAAAFAWAAERARTGDGPVLLELVCMRMCGHAHHDDMLYLGKEPPISWSYPELSEAGYADPESYRYWAERDPIVQYAAVLERDGVVEPGEAEEWKREAEAMVREEARVVTEAPWPDPEDAGRGVYAGNDVVRHREPLEDGRDRVSVAEREEPGEPSRHTVPSARKPLSVEDAPPFDPKGRTFLEAIMLGVQDALAADERVFVYGQDVGGKYGNAFLLLRPLLEEHGDRILNSTLAEGGVLGVCVGAALAGSRPIGEIQFNDFVASGFNQLVNNAAKIRYRWGGSVPMVVRMPWGGLRSAGPYHSQNTEAWFYRTPGLKIVVPSTPHDARALLASALADPDPVLYYEHIALYRDPRIKQALGDGPPDPIPLGRCAVRRVGRHLTVISYGAYVHLAMRAASILAEEGIESTVLDLRSLVPLDRETVLQAARVTGRVLIAHEDTRTGGLGESLAAVIQEEAFEYLDAPIRIVGALDTPVPYSPPLEEGFLPGEERLTRAMRLLARY